MRLVRFLALTCALAFGPAALAQAPFTPDQRKALEEMMGEFLMKNPETLRRAIEAMTSHEEAAQRTAQEAALKAAGPSLVDGSTGLVMGNPDGDVTLVEFSDYNCGFCKKAMADVRALLGNDPKLRIVVRDLEYIGRASSREANMVALAARRQLAGDKLLDFHVRLMESPGRVNGARARAAAREVGLDLARLDKDAAAPEVAATLAANDALARRIGVDGTPAFVVGNEVISGAVGAETLRAAIQNTRKCGRATC